MVGTLSCLVLVFRQYFLQGAELFANNLGCKLLSNVMALCMYPSGGLLEIKGKGATFLEW